MKQEAGNKTPIRKLETGHKTTIRKQESGKTGIHKVDAFITYR